MVNSSEMQRQIRLEEIQLQKDDWWLSFEHAKFEMFDI